MPRLTRLLLPAAALVCAGCNLTEPAPFDPATFQNAQTQRAGEVAPRPMRPLPTTLRSDYLPNAAGRSDQIDLPDPSVATQVRLPLREVIQRAVASNPDVRVAGYNPGIEAARTVEAEARFDPTFFSGLNYEARDRAVAFRTSTSSLFGSEDRADTFTGQAGLRQLLPSGGQAELRAQSAVTDAEFAGSVTPNPFTENELVLQLTQPVLRDFGNEVNRARILISRNNQRISLLDFRNSLEETLVSIEETYWQLVAAERDVEILERLLQETIRTADVLSKRAEHDVTRVQVSQANASVEARRATLVRARARVGALSDRLKRLMGDDQYPIASSVAILPADLPNEQPVQFDLKDLIDTAIRARLEIGQQQLRIDSADIARRVAKNNLLPSLNVIGSGTVQGLDEEFDSAFAQQRNLDNISWSLGMQLEIPIGNREARSIYTRAMLQRLQAIEQYRASSMQVALDVADALREVQTSWDEMIATRQARFAAADSLLAIQQREDNNEPLTPTFVQLKLDTQERLANAAQNENNAIQAYNTSIARLERAKGTLLKFNNVSLTEDMLPATVLAQ